MLYAIFCYDNEAVTCSWSKEKDAEVMASLGAVQDKLASQRRLGPAARLGGTAKARTLRGPGNGMVIDGPFAETKEQLLGFYVLDCADDHAAIEAARTLRRDKPSAVYEIRPVITYLPGKALPE